MKIIYFVFLDVKKLEDIRLSSLFIALKDYNNETLVRMLAMSQSRCIKEAARNENVDLQTVVLKEGRNYSSELLTSFWLTRRLDSSVGRELRAAIKILSPLISIKLVDNTDPGKSSFSS